MTSPYITYYTFPANMPTHSSSIPTSFLISRCSRMLQCLLLILLIGLQIITCSLAGLGLATSSYPPCEMLSSDGPMRYGHTISNVLCEFRLERSVSIYIYIPAPSNVVPFDPWSSFLGLDKFFLSKPTFFVGPRILVRKNRNLENSLFQPPASHSDQARPPLDRLLPLVDDVGCPILGLFRWRYYGLQKS